MYFIGFKVHYSTVEIIVQPILVNTEAYSGNKI